MVLLLPTKESNKKVFKLPFAYHPTQKQVAENPARFKIVRCGRKWGKTTFAQRKALDWLGPSGSVVWFCAPTYRQAKLISWSEFKRIIPPEALGKKPNDTDLTITLKNGSQLFLMGSDDPDSLRGPAPSGVIFEEAAFHKREAWHEVIRPNLMPTKAPALFIGTPKGFNWLKDLEDEARKRIALGNKDWAVFHFTCYDNPYIAKDEIEDAKKDCDTEAVWRQEYLAEYESSVGRVFANFNDDRHFKAFPIPQGSFKAWRAVDWGMRDDSGQLWGTIINRKLIIYREHAESDLSAPQQAQIMRSLTGANELIQNTAISHDAVKEDPAMKGLTVLWHFKQAGISPIRPSSRDKKHSRAMIKQLLSEDRLIISHDCPKIRKQLLSYEWKDTVMEKPEDGNDDLIDALHYLVEMLQFDLFLGKPREETMSTSEIMADIAREKLAQRTRRLELPSIYRKDDSFGDFDNSAGYL